MSLQIDVDRVASVLIAGEWYEVVDNSFGLDSYEFGVYYPDESYLSGKGFDCVHGGGNSGVCAIGFAFRVKHGLSETTWMYGPLTAIQAVRYGK